jgi:hypothetical protein
MRYWLEHGHLKAGVPLLDGYTKILDDLNDFIDEIRTSM